MRHSNHDNNPTTTTASIYCKTSSKVSTSIKQCTRQLVDSPRARNQTRESPQTHNPTIDSQKKKPQTRTTITTERQEELNKTLQQQILAHWQGWKDTTATTTGTTPSANGANRRRGTEKRQVGKEKTMLGLEWRRWGRLLNGVVWLGFRDHRVFVVVMRSLLHRNCSCYCKLFWVKIASI